MFEGGEVATEGRTACQLYLSVLAQHILLVLKEVLEQSCFSQQPVVELDVARIFLAIIHLLNDFRVFEMGNPFLFLLTVSACQDQPKQITAPNKDFILQLTFLYLTDHHFLDQTDFFVSNLIAKFQTL